METDLDDLEKVEQLLASDKPVGLGTQPESETERRKDDVHEKKDDLSKEKEESDRSGLIIYF